MSRTNLARLGGLATVLSLCHVWTTRNRVIIPWDLLIVSSFVRTVRGVILHPTAFFSGLPRRGGLLDPLLFALICTEIAVVLGGLLRLGLIGLGVEVNEPLVRLLFSGTTVQQPAPWEQLFGMGELSAFATTVLVTPVLGAIGTFIGAGVVHLVVRLVVGAANSGFEATFRVLCYAQAVMLGQWIPVVGLLLSLYGIYLQVVGIREMHETTTGRAVGVVVVLVGVGILLSIVFFSVVLWWVMAGRQAG